MPTYTHSVSFDIPDFTPDLTQKMDVSLSTSRSVLKKVNEYLIEAKTAFRKGKPYPSKFEYLSDNEDNGPFPFENVDNFKLIADSIPIDNVGFPIAVLGGVIKAFPEIGVVGKMYNIKPMFGKRNLYEISSPAGDETMLVEQHYNDAMPGDTRVPAPVISDDPEEEPAPIKISSKLTGNSKPTTPGVIKESTKSHGSSSAPSGISISIGQKETVATKLVNKSMVGEPEYILPNDKMNPMALMWLIQNRLFNLNMSWDSGKHSVSRYSYSDDIESRAPEFMKIKDELGQAPFALFNALGEDDASFTNEWVLAALSSENNFPNGDVDILTMVFLCGVGMWEIEETGNSEYLITLDERLARGIPGSYELIARLIWSMREYAEVSEPFKVSFKPTTLAKLKDYISEFEGSAFGAPEKPKSHTMEIDSKPMVDPMAGKERPFDGGRSRAADVGYEESDRSRINDKALFEKLLRRRIKSFPMTVVVNGGGIESKYATERMHLLPGDLVTLVSIWNRQGVWDIDGDVVGIRVYDRNKNQLGSLKESDFIWELGPEDFGHRELACLLPYVTAVVKSVDVNTKDAPAKVTLAFDNKGKSEDEIVAEVLEGMKETYAKRTKLSRSDLVASDLLTEYGWNGEVSNPSPIPDFKNPAPAGSDNPKGERLQICENVIVMAGKDKGLMPVLKKMKQNALKHIEMIEDGWYYNEDDLKNAKTFIELHDAIFRDIREHFRNIFNLKPKASYVEESGQMVAVTDGSNIVWIISYKTWNKPNDDDLKVFFDSVKGAKFGMVRLVKRELEKKARIAQGTYESAVGIDGFLKSYELATPEELSVMSESLHEYRIDSKDHSNLALRCALMEVFGTSEELGDCDASGQSFSIWDGKVTFGITDHPCFALDAQPEEKVEALAEAPATEQLSRQEAEELESGPEPEAYVINGKFDPLAAAWLLYNDFIFFKDDGISWDGKRHRVECIQINSNLSDEIPNFMADAQANVDKLADFFSYLEDDREFVVPREMIAPGLHKAIREGDLTGITLFNLISCGRAMKVTGQKDEDLLGRTRDFYDVTVDERIAKGIPAMQDLCSLLVHDMRMYLEKQDCDQTANISSERIRWADDWLGDVPDFVEGAVLEGCYCMQSSPECKPDVLLPGEEDDAIHMDVTIDLAKLLEDMD